MEVGSCWDLDMSRVYPKTLIGPMFYSWWNCPLREPGVRVRFTGAGEYIKGIEGEMLKSYTVCIFVGNDKLTH